MRRPLTARTSIGSVRSSASLGVRLAQHHLQARTTSATNSGRDPPRHLPLQPALTASARTLSCPPPVILRPTPVRDQFARAYLTVCSHEPHFSAQSSCERVAGSVLRSDRTCLR